MNVDIRWRGAKELAVKLQSMSKASFVEVAKNSTTSIFDRASILTPVGDYKHAGNLRKNRFVEFTKDGGLFYYTMHYAPHVEYGHRLVRHGKQVGYVQGQYYLKRNVDAERPRYERRLKKRLQEEVNKKC